LQSIVSYDDREQVRKALEYFGQPFTVTWQVIAKTGVCMLFAAFECLNYRLISLGSHWVYRSSLKPCSSTTPVLTVFQTVFLVALASSFWWI